MKEEKERMRGKDMLLRGKKHLPGGVMIKETQQIRSQLQPKGVGGGFMKKMVPSTYEVNRSANKKKKKKKKKKNWKAASLTISSRNRNLHHGPKKGRGERQWDVIN